MKRRKLRSTPKDPLETGASLKVKYEVLNEASSSSSFGKEIVYAELIQNNEPPSDKAEPELTTVTAASFKDCTNSRIGLPSSDSLKNSTNPKLPSEDTANIFKQPPEDNTNSELPLSDGLKDRTKLFLSTTEVKKEPKSEINLLSDLTQDIIPNEFVLFCDEMRIRIMTRHPKAKPEDAEELLNLLTAEYHEFQFRDHTHLKMKPMPYRLKLMRNAKNCFVKLEILSNKNDYNFELKREVDSKFSGFHDQEFPFNEVVPMAPMASAIRSTRGGRVLKVRSRADDMLYYQADHTSPNSIPPLASARNLSRGRAGRKRIKSMMPFNHLTSNSIENFSPCAVPVSFMQISPQKPKRAYNKKIQMAREKGTENCFLNNNLVTPNEHPTPLISSLETLPANNCKETDIPSDNPSLTDQSLKPPDNGYDSDISSVNKSLPSMTDLTADNQPKPTKEASQEKPKRTYKKRSKAADVIDLAYKALIKEEDECDVIGNLVTMKLRNIMKINPTMKILAEKLINETIFEAEMGTLTPYHSIVIDHSQSYSPRVDQSTVPYPCNFDQSAQTFPLNINHAPSACPTANQNTSGIASNVSQNPPTVSFNFNQNLSYYNPCTTDQPRNVVRSTDRPNNFLSL